tara:strand:+ start:182 stop:676 length:495 start_codon:yes stop_codon:yes gene_type:complete
MSSTVSKACLLFSLACLLNIAAAKTISHNGLYIRGGASDEGPTWPKTNNPHILVAGGAGYIATHTIVCLLEQGYDVTVVDNLINSSTESLKRVKELTGCEDARLRYYDVDMTDKAALEKVFKSSPKFNACIQFAGLKAVSFEEGVIEGGYCSVLRYLISCGVVQ